MKKIFFIITIIGFFASCGTKKRVITTKNPTHKIEQPIVKAEQPEIEQPTTISQPETTTVTHKKFTSTEYIRRFATIAVKEMHKYKIPASITLAQGILESSNGKSRLATKANNHFGIKCHKKWQGDSITHDDDALNECFRKYNNPEESFRDHSLFLTNRSRYSKLFQLNKYDYKGWAKGLKKAGYATDKKYPQKLIAIIERYNLHQYDMMLPQDLPQEVHQDFEESIVEENSSNIKTTGNYYEVKQGDTLYSIAKKNNTTVKKIKKINGLTNNNINIGQQLLVN